MKEIPKPAYDWINGAEKPSKNWPRLSTKPKYTQHPCLCQQCYSNENLTCWQECDDDDKPDGCYVILCETCAKQVVPPHPRLYIKESWYAPRPGAMPCCTDCKFRFELTCKQYHYERDGIQNLNLIIPETMSGFADGRDKTGRRVGYRFVSYSGPVRCGRHEKGTSLDKL